VLLLRGLSTKLWLLGLVPIVGGVPASQLKNRCFLLGQHYNDIVPDHKDSKGMGGAWRDDRPDNIQATHWWYNDEKESTRIDD
jgi:hypothetical protein